MSRDPLVPLASADSRGHLPAAFTHQPQSAARTHPLARRSPETEETDGSPDD
jgi:hypothetical protein